MFQVKFIYFVVSLTLVVCTTDFGTYDGYDIKRSAVCLIQRVAQHNHIVAKFEKVNFEQNNGTTHVECKLDLGDEHYNSSSTSLSKAKEKVSREAYALTKYTKPPLENRTCAVNGPGKKSDISFLEEYAHVIHKRISYTEGRRNSNGTIEFMASLDGKSASGIGHRKKLAKQAAATNLLQIIGRLTVIDALIAKYNQTKYHKMEPTLRLRKIARVTDPTADAVYTIKRGVLKGGEGQVTLILAEVMANDYVAAGTGNTQEEARRNAAANLLRTMEFTVIYQPRLYGRNGKRTNCARPTVQIDWFGRLDRYFERPGLDTMLGLFGRPEELATKLKQITQFFNECARDDKLITILSEMLKQLIEI